MEDLLVVQLGTVEYREGVRLQERVRAARQAGAIGDVLLLLEHPPVYTQGRRSDARELPMGRDWYLSQGIDVVKTDRGGKVTYHGPGQLVGYPIMAVTDVLAHLRRLEVALVAALAEEGIEARSRVDDGPAFTGVWVAERKIASLGLHVARGVSTHGFAVNVQNDLQPFTYVVPCGLPGVAMTSIVKETGTGGDRLTCFRRRAGAHVARAFGRRQRLLSAARLERALSGVAPPRAEAAPRGERPPRRGRSRGVARPPRGQALPGPRS
ncbi:MAG TPA: lipoyl(octanoyl) transferase LipB [Solirubrobacteraceae bacterium]|nr:lipoyl(octanoyl) transferase LipB [Solirubrobacteraceae bacterium]